MVQSIGRFIVAAMLVVFLSTPAADAQLPVEAIRQNWYGELDAGPRLFRFEVVATLGRDGQWSGELTSLDEGGAKFRLDNVLIDSENLSFELKQTQAKFSGKLSEKKTTDGSVTADGEWTQRGASLPLVFRRFDVMPEDLPTEVWVGDLKAGPQKLIMQFRVYLSSNGEERVFADSVSQRAGGFKATRRKGDQGEIIFEVPVLKGQFSGTPIDDGKLRGKWSQGVSLDLELRKAERPVEPAAVVRKRPQMPAEPFPYRVENVQFSGGDAGVILDGTLTIPEDASKENRVPAAVLITGSGPQDRDETLLGHKPFWVLADHLSRHGIAVLRYDDRGVGKSTGDFGTATTEDFAQDAWAALQFLATHDLIDAKRSGLVGHSEGGIVAPLVAAEHPEVAWIVLLAGTGVNGEQILYSQGEKIVLADGGSAEVALQQRIVQESIIRFVKTMPVDDATETQVSTIVDSILADARWKSENTPQSDESNIRETLKTQVSAALVQMNSPWFRFFMTHEPAPVLERVRCPVLALNGELDLQVVAELNLPPIESALKTGGNSNYRIVKLPGLNHLFQTCKTGSPSEYEQIEETMAPVALETVSEFIRETTHNKTP